MSYIFYDLETSGLNKPYDQIFQFGAIHADSKLNKLGAIDLKCKRLREVIPSPKALLITRVHPDELSERKRTHYQMISEIVGWVGEKQPVTFIGHNSIDFDESFFRFGLYKTLNDPYLTQAGGSFRADTMIMSHAVSIHDAKAIRVPTIGGKKSFRLGPLARINGIKFSEDDAHDAFADIEATLELAKYIKENSPDIWEIMEKHSDPRQVIRTLETEDYAFLSAVYFGRSYSYVVCKAALNTENNKEVGVFDLSIDPTPYLDLSVDELVKTLSSREKPIRVIRANKYPIIIPKNFPPAHVKGGVLDSKVYEKRANLVRSNHEFQERLGRALPQRYEPGEPSPYVEDQIYDGFITDYDKHLMKTFHQVPWSQRADVLAEMSDERLKIIGMRLICSEALGEVPEEEQAKYHEWIKYRATTVDDVSWNTLGKAMTELRDIGGPSDPEEAKLVNEIGKFLDELASEFF